MPGIVDRDDDDLERAIETATNCEECEVTMATFAAGSGAVYDLCERHYWELRAERRSPSTDEDVVAISPVDRTALQSFGVPLDDGANRVTADQVADLDLESVAADVPDDPDAVRVLGILARFDPEAVAKRQSAVEACLPLAEEWADGASGARAVLGSVAPVDPDVARSLLAAARTDEVPFHVAGAIRQAVRAAPEAMLSIRSESGESLLVDTIAAAGRAGATSSPLVLTALLVAREAPEAFVDHVAAFLPSIEREWHHWEAAATTFDAAATLGRTAAVDPDAVEELREKLHALGTTTHADPAVEATVRAAGAVAFAHAPTLAERAGVDREWLRDRLARVLDDVGLPDPTREEAAIALGRFANADDREYLSWVAAGSEDPVATAARRAADGGFRVAWPEGVLDPDPGAERAPDDSPLADALPTDPSWEVPEEYAVGFAVFDALGATPEGAFEPAADQWSADWTAPLARLTAAHEVAVLDLGSPVDLNVASLTMGLDVVTYHPDHLPYLRYDPGSTGEAVFLSAAGVAVCSRVTDRTAAVETLLALSEDLAEIGVDPVDSSAVRFATVGELLS